MKRNVGLDIIKSLAILFVVCVHFFLNTNFYSAPMEGTSMLFQLTCRWVFIICVPLFLIVTGYLQSEKEPSITYFKKISPILGIYLFYSLVSVLLRVVYFGEQGSVFKWTAAIFSFQANGYAWYVNMYIGLFILAPFLNVIFKHFRQKKEHQILLLAMVFLTVLPGFTNAFPFIPGQAGHAILPSYWVDFYPVTYYFIGCYIKKYQVVVNRALAVMMFAGITVLATILTFYFSWDKTFTYVVGDYASLLVTVQAVAFFLIFYKIDLSNKYLRGLFGLIGAVSLDIYLCSYVTDRFVYKFVMENLFTSQPQIILFALPAVAVSFTIALIAAVTRKKATGAVVKMLAGTRPGGREV